MTNSTMILRSWLLLALLATKYGAFAQQESTSAPADCASLTTCSECIAVTSESRCFFVLTTSGGVCQSDPCPEQQKGVAMKCAYSNPFSEGNGPEIFDRVCKTIQDQFVDTAEEQLCDAATDCESCRAVTIASTGNQDCLWHGTAEECRLDPKRQNGGRRVLDDEPTDNAEFGDDQPTDDAEFGRPMLNLFPNILDPGTRICPSEMQALCAQQTSCSACLDPPKDGASCVWTSSGTCTATCADGETCYQPDNEIRRTAQEACTIATSKADKNQACISKMDQSSCNAALPTGPDTCVWVVGGTNGDYCYLALNGRTVTVSGVPSPFTLTTTMMMMVALAVGLMEM